MKTKIWMQQMLFAGLLAMFGCTEFDALPESGSVVIGNQEWMVVNLDTDTFRNGDPIPHAPTAEAWAVAANNHQPAWCYYKNDAENGDLFGRLYNFYAVTDPRGLAPAGWHLPNYSEWQMLANHLAKEGVLSASLKSDRLWASYENSERGTNSSGFTALPGSFRMKDGLYYPYVDQGTGYAAYFWSTTRHSDTAAYVRQLTIYNNGFPALPMAYGAGASVRCLRGDEPLVATVVVGAQEWMVRNLDTDTFRNGDLIPIVSTTAEWAEASANKTPAWCYYMDDPANGTTYGRLYNWYAVADSRGLAPVGWKIPDEADWTELGDFLSAYGWDGGALKAVVGWAPPHAEASNATGFTALPGEMRFENGAFYEGAELALFWSNHEVNAEKASARGLHGEVNNYSIFFHLKGAGLSVRCVRD